MGQAAHPLSNAGARIFYDVLGMFLPLDASQHADSFMPVKYENSILSNMYHEHDRAFKNLGTAVLEPSLSVTIALRPAWVTLPALE